MLKKIICIAMTFCILLTFTSCKKEEDSVQIYTPNSESLAGKLSFDVTADVAIDFADATEVFANNAAEIALKPYIDAERQYIVATNQISETQTYPYIELYYYCFEEVRMLEYRYISTEHIEDTNAKAITEQLKTIFGSGLAEYDIETSINEMLKVEVEDGNVATTVIETPNNLTITVSLKNSDKEYGILIDAKYIDGSRMTVSQL